jgi:hypothetical protein
MYSRVLKNEWFWGDDVKRESTSCLFSYARTSAFGCLMDTLPRCSRCLVCVVLVAAVDVCV